MKMSKELKEFFIDAIKASESMPEFFDNVFFLEKFLKEFVKHLDQEALDFFEASDIIQPVKKEK